jgi:hypothetical protein
MNIPKVEIDVYNVVSLHPMITYTALIVIMIAKRKYKPFLLLLELITCKVYVKKRSPLPPEEKLVVKGGKPRKRVYKPGRNGKRQILDACKKKENASSGKSNPC